jgi:ribosomal protein S18 acetylase RimI-like enzyme
MPQNIRDAQLKDASLLFELELNAFQVEEATSLDIFQELLGRSPCPYVFRVVEKNGIVVGFYCMDLRGNKTVLYDIVVKKEFQGKGFGNLLMKDCLEFAIDSQVGVLLKVREDNRAAIKLYGKFSY